MWVDNENKRAQIIEEKFGALFGDFGANEWWMGREYIYISYLKANKILFELKLGTEKNVDKKIKIKLE